MKRLRYLFRAIIALLFSLLDCSAQNVDSLLAAAYNRDQNVRLQMIELTRAVTVDGKTELIDSLLAVQSQLQNIDDENINLVESLVVDGLPKNLSQSSYNTIWLIIDHADIDHQEHYLPMIEQAVRDKLVSAAKYATLYDRIEMKRGRPQLYGTQSHLTNRSGTLTVYV